MSMVFKGIVPQKFGCLSLIAAEKMVNKWVSFYLEESKENKIEETKTEEKT